MPVKISFEGNKKNLLSGVIHRKREKDLLVVTVHGFGTDKNYRVLKEMSKFLDNKKIASMRFDLSGTGESEGDVKDSSLEQMVIDVNSAVRYAKKLGYKRIMLVGHSLGGMVGILTAAINKDVRALILMAPAIDLKYKIKKRKDTYKFTKDGLVEVARTKVKKAFLKNISRNVYNHSKKLNIPVLIVHGDADKSCDVKDSKKFYKNLKTKKKMIIVRTGNHHFSKQTHLDKVLKSAHSWIKHL